MCCVVAVYINKIKPNKITRHTTCMDTTKGAMLFGHKYTKPTTYTDTLKISYAPWLYPGPPGNLNDSTKEHEPS